MKLLEEIILRESTVLENDVLKVDSFLNHRIDTLLMNEIGKEFAQRFQGLNITKILTVETSGIAPAVFTGFALSVPVLFAKKAKSITLDSGLYEANIYSYTKMQYYTISVSKKYLTKRDNVLIIDDFMANGQAVRGLLEIIKQSGAHIVGAGIVIEKGFQGGGKSIREEGIRVESLAIVDKMSEKNILFKKEEDKK